MATPREPAVAPDVAAAITLAHRMRAALVRGDNRAFDTAHHELLRVEAEMRSTPEADAGMLAALDRALAMSALSRSAEAARQLQHAADAVIASARP